VKAKELIANSRQQLSLSIILVGGVALLAGLIAVILAAASDNEQTSIELPNYSGISSSWQNRNILGDPDAPVTVQAWEDFRCPACAAFNQRVKPGLVDNYISSGKVKLEFRHFPLQHTNPALPLPPRRANVPPTKEGSGFTMIASSRRLPPARTPFSWRV